jgi:hypothetical protein
MYGVLPRIAVCYLIASAAALMIGVGVVALFTRSGLDTTFPLYPSVRAALDRTG